mmetsp:Transcript_12449/g.30234  ORF Transcript_12449/g.30234 Transcript_12449/m.30234 type:complete len:259 (+) Transcript_12449:1473-2249(+)
MLCTKPSGQLMRISPILFLSTFPSDLGLSRTSNDKVMPLSLPASARVQSSPLPRRSSPGWIISPLMLNAASRALCTSSLPNSMMANTLFVGVEEGISARTPKLYSPNTSVSVMVRLNCGRALGSAGFVHSISAPEEGSEILRKFAGSHLISKPGGCSTTMTPVRSVSTVTKLKIISLSWSCTPVYRTEAFICRISKPVRSSPHPITSCVRLVPSTYHSVLYGVSVGVSIISVTTIGPVNPPCITCNLAFARPSCACSG